MAGSPEPTFPTVARETSTRKFGPNTPPNNRISALMRNLNDSDWFAEPNLKSIKEDPANPDYGEKASTFDLTFAQVNPNDAEEGN